jgi:hypothetical protein
MFRFAIRGTDVMIVEFFSPEQFGVFDSKHSQILLK